MEAKRTASGILVSAKRFNDIEVEIGRKGAKKFLPEISQKRFGGKAYLNFSHADAEIGGTPEWQGNKLVTTIRKRKHRMYGLANGDLEYEIEYSQKPVKMTETLYLDFPDGLAFYLQTPPTQEQLNRGYIQPDDVLNSYAVYWKQTGNEYRTGKFAHIYRPKVIDAQGAEAWCEQIIDPVAKTLTIIMPEEFMQNAAYPVILDPTFGNTNIGANTDTMPANYIEGFGPFVPASSGTVTSMSMYLTSGGQNMKFILYGDSAGYPGTLLGKTASFANASGWNTQNLITPVAITGGATYWLSHMQDALINSKSDVLTGGKYKSGQTFGTEPDPFPSSASSENNIKSIYATYTATPTNTEMNLNRSPIRGVGRGIMRP